MDILEVALGGTERERETEGISIAVAGAGAAAGAGAGAGARAGAGTVAVAMVETVFEKETDGTDAALIVFYYAYRKTIPKMKKPTNNKNRIIYVVCFVDCVLI